MTMRTLRKLELGVLTFAATALTSTLAHAMPAASCGVKNNTAQVTLPTAYDPFGSAGIPNGPFTLTLQRPDTNTAAVNLFFYTSSSAGYDIKSGSNSIVSHQRNSPNLDTSNPPTNSLLVTWLNNATTTTVNLIGVVPPGLDLAAGSNDLSFDLYYVCSGAPNSRISGNGSIPDALDMNFTVRSGLQATYSGVSFDFGRQDISHPITKLSGNVRVASSGPFTVDVAAGSGSAWAMTYPGGSPSNANQRLYYQLTFLGKTGSHSHSIVSTTTCQRTGIGGQNLPITAQITETAANKDSAPDYSDYISVTVTPLASGSNNGSPKVCSTMGQGENSQGQNNND